LKGGKGYKGRSFLLLFRMDERMNDPMEMLLNTRWKAAHLAKQCALKLAFLETFSAFQLYKECKYREISEITLEKFQPSNSWGC
jgi:hypothetical protein